VGGNVIDGSGWIAKRLAHLRSLLDSELSDEDKGSIEDEIAVLSKEQGLRCGGPSPTRTPAVVKVDRPLE
jgi:hypothetical protein